MSCTPEGIERTPLYRRTEQLLRDYNSMKARVSNLQIDLTFIKGIPDRMESVDEAIAGEYFAKSNESIPTSGHGDKTASVALRWLEKHGQDVADMYDYLIRDGDIVQQEINALNTLLSKVDNAIASLSKDERIIVNMFYIEQKHWYEVAHEVKYGERQCKRLRTRAIWYMSKSIFGVGKVYS